MAKNTALFIALLLISDIAHAGRNERYTGTAKAQGRVVYLEHHLVEYDEQGRVKQAETRYERSDGSPIAVLRSDFQASLTVPDHKVEDLRTREIQGLRRKEGKIELFFQDPNQPEFSRILADSDAENRILVGCQGLNYYLLSNFEKLPPRQILPLRFLIPGKLDYYDFDMRRIGAPQGDIQAFEISVRSWFLKIFAPTLRVKYDTKRKHIVWYEGISNIKDDQGKNQMVVIDYVYE